MTDATVKPDRDEDGLTSWDAGSLCVVLDRTGSYPAVFVDDEGNRLMELDRHTARAFGEALIAAADEATS